MESNHYVQLYPLERYILPPKYDYDTNTHEDNTIKAIQISLNNFSITESVFSHIQNERIQEFTLSKEIKYFSAKKVQHMSHNTALRIAHLIYDCVFSHNLLGNGIISRKTSTLPIKIIYHITKDHIAFFLIGSKKTQPHADGSNKIGRRILLCSRIKNLWQTKELWLLNNIKGKSTFIESRHLEQTLYSQQPLRGIFPEIVFDCQVNGKHPKRYCFYEQYMNLYYFSECTHMQKPYFSICRQLAQHIHALHRQGYIIGDIKLDNTLIDRDNSVRLCDLDAISKSPPLFPLHQGTAAYSAPECFNTNRQDVQTWQSADVFAFGCLIYELITNFDVPWFYDGANFPENSMKDVCGYEKIYAEDAKKAHEYFSTTQAHEDFTAENPRFLCHLASVAMHPQVTQRYTIQRIVELLTTGK